MARGLMLTGGGARAAYQAGVLSGVAEIIDRFEGYPFPILTGVSAGAINVAFLGCRAPDFRGATRELQQLWCNLEMDHVFRTDVIHVSNISLAWLRNLALGGLLGHHSRFNALLDPEPLRKMLVRNLDFATLRAQLNAGLLHGVALLATHFASGASVAFIEAAGGKLGWTRARRLGREVELGVAHVMASNAIPFIFPAVQLGESFWGDGSVRMTSPLSPAIHLGADRILVVTVRKSEPMKFYSDALEKPAPRPSVAALAGSLLDAVFLDAIDGDLERLQRINLTLSRMAPEARAETGLKTVSAVLVSPSQDLAALAAPHLDRFPRKIRYLLKGLGADLPESPEFLSYILFDRRYCTELFELGRSDARARESDVRQMFAPVLC